MGLVVSNQPENSRYILEKDGEQVGVAEYRQDADTITFTHTAIDEDKRERGMASELVQTALDDVRSNSDRRVIAVCPYVKHWLTEHSEYQDLQSR
jgi:predicted GNAT family acetyltransferase